MSVLKKLSRKKEDEPKVQPVSTRLTEKEYNRFADLCEKTGYSISEAVRLLIQKEIESDDDERIHRNTERIQDADERIPKEATPSASVIKRYTPVNHSIRSGRFTTTEWLVEDKLPCPLCLSWVSASNFSRHAKQHGMTTKEIFTIYKDKADAMVENIDRKKDGF